MNGDPNSKKEDRIYSQRLKMLLKNAIMEERHSTLTVDADLQSSNNGLFRKELVIRITDDEDPLFYYHMKLNDDDYQSLRLQQGLLVDFVAFPQKFVDLLELCRQEEVKHNPRFVVQLTFSESHDGSQLSIVEVNPFKHLVHLSLMLVAGTDNEVKRFLAGYLKSMKSKNEKLQSHVQSTESELSSRLRESKENLADKCRAYDRLQNELRDQTSALQNRLELQVNREKDRILQIERSLEDKHNRELRELEAAHHKLVSRLESNLSALESQVGDLGAKRQQADQVIHELRNRVDASERELQTLRHESHELNRDKLHLQKSRDEWERSAGQLSSRVASLEQDCRERETQLTRQQIQIDSFAEQKSALTMDLSQKQALVIKRTDSVKTLSEELNKGNEIIRKLQTEIRNLQSKVKLRNQVTLEQEKVVTEKEKQVEFMQSRLITLEERLSQHESEAKKLKESLTEAQTKLEDNTKIIKTNENVINWLNKQLNEAQSNPRKNDAGTTSGLPFGVLGNVANLFATSTPTLTGVAATNSTPTVQFNADLAPPIVRRSPFSAIPEESNIPHHTTTPKNLGAENDPPLDSKYFRTKPTAVRAPGSTPLSSAAQSRPRFVSNVRLPRTSIAPLASGKDTDVRGFPLSSAYFPSS